MNLQKRIVECKLVSNGRGSSQIMRLLNLNFDGLFDELFLQTQFLDNVYIDVSIAQRLYHVWFSVDEILYCPICDEPRKYGGHFSINQYLKGKNYYQTCGKISCKKQLNIDHTRLGCQKKYGVDNIFQVPEIRKRIIETNMDKYGVPYPVEMRDFQDKAKQTWIEKYGVDHPLKSDLIQKKIQATCLDKYGVESYLSSDEKQIKSKKTCQQKYGVDNPMQSDLIQKKVQETCLERYGDINIWKSLYFKEKTKQSLLNKYGVEHNSQISGHTHGYKWYTYILPSGKEVKIQGYEGLFLDEYFFNGGTEENIIIENINIEKEVGKIWYIFNNKRHRYFPDFYLINEHKIIEIKSDWTMHKNEDINELKRQSCILMGLDFEYKIY